MILKDVIVQYDILRDFQERNKVDLSLGEMLFYSILQYHSYNGGNTFITNKTLASETNFSVRTITNFLNKFNEIGLIKIEFEFNESFNQNIRYITPLLWGRIGIYDPKYVKRPKLTINDNKPYSSKHYDISDGYESL